MSRRVKKEVSSLSFSMNKLYQRISTARPSTVILSGVIIAVAIFLFGGGLYDIITRPFPAIYTSSSGFLFLYPQLGEQFISDSLVAMIIYTMGIVGLIVAYQSTKYAFKPRQAYMTFLVGIALLLIAYIFLEVTIRIKMSG